MSDQLQVVFINLLSNQITCLVLYTVKWLYSLVYAADNRLQVYLDYI